MERIFYDAISRAPYCIWIGCYESQGFAFQEILSCNTPIFVINVQSLREEINGNRVISCPERWKENWDLFINKSNFIPRNFIMNTLSPNIYVKNWTEKILSLK